MRYLLIFCLLFSGCSTHNDELAKRYTIIKYSGDRISDVWVNVRIYHWSTNTRVTLIDKDGNYIDADNLKISTYSESHDLNCIEYHMENETKTYQEKLKEKE